MQRISPVWVRSARSQFRSTQLARHNFFILSSVLRSEWPSEREGVFWNYVRMCDWSSVFVLVPLGMISIQVEPMDIHQSFLSLSPRMKERKKLIQRFGNCYLLSMFYDIHRGLLRSYKARGVITFESWKGQESWGFNTVPPENQVRSGRRALSNIHFYAMDEFGFSIRRKWKIRRQSAFFISTHDWGSACQPNLLKYLWMWNSIHCF